MPRLQLHNTEFQIKECVKETRDSLFGTLYIYEVRVQRVNRVKEGIFKGSIQRINRAIHEGWKEASPKIQCLRPQNVETTECWVITVHRGPPVLI